jgi:hypothetical protein
MKGSEIMARMKLRLVLVLVLGMLMSLGIDALAQEQRRKGVRAVKPGAPTIVWLDELDMTKAVSRWREWLGDSQCNLAVQGKPLSLGDRKFERGIGIREGGMRIRLDGGSTRLQALVGVDKALKHNSGPTEVSVLADDEILWESGVIHAGESPREIDVDLTGRKELLIEITGTVNANAWSYGHADLVDARLEVVGKRPRAIPFIPDIEKIEQTWKTGQTLDLEYSKRFPLPPRVPKDDTGINVLIDLARECSFAVMWSLPGQLYDRGLRTCGSQATLHNLLTPGKPCRVRIPIGGKWPFAWWPVPKFNVVVTHNSSSGTQGYLPEEREALKKFVRGGGGLVVIGGRAPEGDKGAEWTLNKLAAIFGGAYTSETDRFEKRGIPTLKLDAAWEVTARGEKGLPVIARRTFGKGRVVLLGSGGVMDYGNRPEKGQAKRQDRLADNIKWAAAGSPPVGGEPRLPQPMSGGGGIFPELEQRVPGVVVFYAANQLKHLLKTVREDIPKASDLLYEWLPTKRPDALMFLVLSAGGGGGWAVNIYYPREIGIISLSRTGFISIFGHEQAHTMSGPSNAKGTFAAQWPHGNQSESHAGWFQGKIYTHFTDPATASDRKSRGTWNKDHKSVDLAKTGRRGWGKMWYVWQKMEDRYGTTWYPRWRWVQYTRWQDEPSRKLTWDETVEDMSIAAGEDLFPFFREIGTTLDKDRLERIEFMGETLELPVAPIHDGPTGNARFEPIGDYTKPIKPDPATR